MDKFTKKNLRFAKNNQKINGINGSKMGRVANTTKAGARVLDLGLAAAPVRGAQEHGREAERAAAHHPTFEIQYAIL
jgi:hypothetical protein